MSDAQRPPHVFVIAPNRRWFENWCRMDCSPPENPNDRKFVVFSDEHALHRGRGFRVDERDKLIILGDPRSAWREPKPYRDPDTEEMVYPDHPLYILLGIMLSLGFRTFEDGFGCVSKL